RARGALRTPGAGTGVAGAVRCCDGDRFTVAVHARLLDDASCVPFAACVLALGGPRADLDGARRWLVADHRPCASCYPGPGHASGGGRRGGAAPVGDRAGTLAKARAACSVVRPATAGSRGDGAERGRTELRAPQLPLLRARAGISSTARRSSSTVS